MVRARCFVPALFAFTLLGCAVTHPPDYEQLASEPPLVAEATRGVMYGVAPWSWDLPDGRKILLDSERGSLVSGMGLYRLDAAFEVQFDGGGTRLQCATQPEGPGLPSTRFGCWDEGGRTTFWFADGAACTARDIGAMETMTTPECWRGVLDIGGSQYRVAYAHTAKSKIVVDRVTWTDPEGRVVQAANIVAEGRVELFHPAALSVSPLDGDTLVLHALALHRYSQLASM